MWNTESKTTSSTGISEKMKIGHNGMQFILDELCRCHRKAFVLARSNNACWKLFTVVVLY